MKSFALAKIHFLATLLPAGLAAHALTIDTVYVGDLGNPNDTTGYGAVNVGYNIGKFEITLNQYTEFLNAVADLDSFGLYHPNMATDLNSAGITRTGSSAAYIYSVLGDGQRPVTYVSWHDAARFANWMHNQQPNTGTETAATTEQGAYTLNGAISGVILKNANARWWIPSENEWYKAAYYQPAAAAGDADGYWLYPTASNATPNSRNGSATDSNSANFNFNDGIANGFNGGFAVTNSTSYSTTQNYLTPVGAFTLADSYYGTFDQGGNVWEWNDGILSASSRGLRGGGWTFDFGQFDMQALLRDGNDPTLLTNYIGFRLATVPEPTAAVSVTLGALLFPWRRKNRSPNVP